MPKKVLILTAPFGGGHHATAAKLAAILRERDATIVVETLDPITDAWPIFGRSMSEVYQKSTSAYDAFLFKQYYRLTDRFPTPWNRLASAGFIGYAARKLEEIQPDLVISTFPFLGHVTVKARAKIGRDVPVVTVITDAGRVQGIWLTGSEDKILTATPDTVGYARDRGLANDKIEYVGFPMNAEFYTVPDKAAARQKLGLDPATCTVLVTSGGLGMSASKAVALVRCLAAIPQAFQIICVAGKNVELQREFEAITFKPASTCRVYGYSDQMPLLMAASDLVISKSGWLTLSEALAVKRPLFLFDMIPGQEEQNARYVTANGYGIQESDPIVMAGKIADVINDPSQLQKYDDALARRNDRSSTARLADYFIRLLNHDTV